MTDSNLINNKCNLVNEITEEIIDDNGNKKIIIKQIYKEYTTYNESRKKINKKYFENNKEKIIKYRTDYNRKRYNEDPLYREKAKEAVKRCREKKKLENNIN